MRTRRTVAAAPGANGRFPADSTVAVTPQRQVAAELADQLGALLVAAAAAGVGLAPETNSDLRSGVPPPRGIEILLPHWTTCNPLRTYSPLHRQAGEAAGPGTSKHGWGHGSTSTIGSGRHLHVAGLRVAVRKGGAVVFSQPESVRPGGANEEAWHWEALSALYAMPASWVTH